MAQAMTILRALEDSADGVRDPTAYIRAAVNSAGGEVEIDEHDEFAEEKEDEEEVSAPVSAKRVKKEVKHESADVSGYGLAGAKAEDLTEADRIERRIRWLNSKGQMDAHIVPKRVMPALVSIGFRQSMRVLRRLEESVATVADPNEFIRELASKAGWIWSKTDTIEDDQKVSKRVAWLNQFGGLRKPIKWSEVADTLDGLRVAHAMVLLRELEVNSDTVADPTAYIKRMAGSAGEDVVQAPLGDGAEQDSAIAQRVAWLNEHAGLANPIDYAEVSEDLGRIKEKDAVEILQQVEDKGSGVKDPTGFIKFKLRAKLAGMGTEAAAEDDETKIVKRVEWLNDYGGLLKDIEYNRVSGVLASVGIDHAMTVLKELEDNRESIPNPTSFISSTIASSRGQPASGWGKNLLGKTAATARRGAAAPVGSAGTPDLATLSSLVDLLSRRVKKPVKLSEVADALESLGARAVQVLKEMQEKGLGLDDPVAYIRAAADRKKFAKVVGVKKEDSSTFLGEEEDDVAKITKRIVWLNKFGCLKKSIKTSDVIGALYCLGIPQSMAILKGLQERAAKIPDPTQYVKEGVQRANKVNVAKGEEEPDEAPEEEWPQADMETEEHEDAADARGRWYNI